MIEGAHGPVSVRADRILHERGIPVVPDILANAGGIVVGYFEWVQNRQGFAWQAEVVLSACALHDRGLGGRGRRCRKSASVRLRTAANMLAVSRVAAADKLRGVYA